MWYTGASWLSDHVICVFSSTRHSAKFGVINLMYGCSISDDSAAFLRYLASTSMFLFNVSLDLALQLWLY